MPRFGFANISDHSTRTTPVTDFEFAHRDRDFVLRVEAGVSVALLFNGVQRKERRYAGREPLYVWTNVELEWEEHHYIEARYWPSTGVLAATVNGDALANWQLEPVSPSLRSQGSGSDAGSAAR